LLVVSFWCGKRGERDTIKQLKRSARFYRGLFVKRSQRFFA
jgi:hypothetical protein